MGRMRTQIVIDLKEKIDVLRGRISKLDPDKNTEFKVGKFREPDAPKPPVEVPAMSAEASKTGEEKAAKEPLSDTSRKVNACQPYTPSDDLLYPDDCYQFRPPEDSHFATYGRRYEDDMWPS